MHKFAVVNVRQVNKTTQICLVSLRTFNEIWVSCNRIKPSAIKDGLILGLTYKNSELFINPQRLDSLFGYLRYFHRNCLFEFAQDLNTCSLFSISYMSSYKVSWRCRSCGGVWESSPRFRFSSQRNIVCPYCSGKIFKRGINDLQTTDKELISDWDYDKNLVLPTQITRKYQGKPWWKCKKCGYSWRESLQLHLSNSDVESCPKCLQDSLKKGTSNPELQLYDFIAREYECTHRGKLRGLEFDILSKEHHFAIEYDGFKWHNDSLLQDINKNKVAKQEGYYLIRVRDKGLSAISAYDCINLMLKDFSSLEECFMHLLRCLWNLID